MGCRLGGQRSRVDDAAADDERFAGGGAFIAQNFAVLVIGGLPMIWMRRIAIRHAGLYSKRRDVTQATIAGLIFFYFVIAFTLSLSERYGKGVYSTTLTAESVIFFAVFAGMTIDSVTRMSLSSTEFKLGSVIPGVGASTIGIAAFLFAPWPLLIFAIPFGAALYGLTTAPRLRADFVEQGNSHFFRSETGSTCMEL